MLYTSDKMQDQTVESVVAQVALYELRTQTKNFSYFCSSKSCLSGARSNQPKSATKSWGQEVLGPASEGELLRLLFP